MAAESQGGPRDDEEAAAFRGMGQAIAAIRERQGMGRDELASKAGIERSVLERIERGETDEFWGGIRSLAQALDIPLDALFIEAEKFAPEDEGEKLPQTAGEADSDRATPGGRSDLPEGGSGRRGR